MRRCTVQRTAPSHRPMYSSPLIGFTLIWLLSSALWWVLLLAWLVGCTQASSLHTLPLLVLKVSAQTEGPINEEAFPVSLSLSSLFTYMWPPHTLHQLSFASFLPIWLIQALFLSGSYTVLTGPQSTALDEFGCFCQSHWLWQWGCAGSCCHIFSSHLCPLLGCCSTDEVSCAGKAC